MPDTADVAALREEAARLSEQMARLQAALDRLGSGRDEAAGAISDRRLKTDAYFGLPADLVEIGRAAQIAGVSKPTMRRWCAHRRLGIHPSGFAVRVGARWRVSRKHLRDYIARPNSVSDLSD